MGTMSDWAALTPRVEILTKVNIVSEREAVSAHHTPPKPNGSARTTYRSGGRFAGPVRAGDSHPGQLAGLRMPANFVDPGPLS